ncbi:MAG: ABC transporter ATP-binding protein [Candidatus Enteromonas sp.]|nr:ABC transporter ATP-binding protein [Candidatus Enteromonas sp.]
MNSFLELKNTSLSYQNHGRKTIVCESLNASFPERQVSVLLGSSGVGKTTLLSYVAGILPGEGEILFEEKRIDLLPANQREIAYVTQDYRLYPHMTVFENIAFPLRLMHASREEIEKRVGEIAERLGIAILLSRKPKQLSGGQQQKIALARSLVWNPSILLLDEPFSGLDPNSRGECRRYFQKILHEFPLTTLLVTHSWDDAMALGDRVFVLQNGKIAFEGTPFDAAQSPYLPAFSEVRP